MVLNAFDDFDGVFGLVISEMIWKWNCINGVIAAPIRENDIDTTIYGVFVRLKSHP